MNIFYFYCFLPPINHKQKYCFFSSFFIYFIAPACLQKNSSFMATGKGFMGEIEKIIIKKKHQQTSHEKTNVKHRKT